MPQLFNQFGQINAKVDKVDNRSLAPKTDGGSADSAEGHIRINLGCSLATPQKVNVRSYIKNRLGQGNVLIANEVGC